MIDNLELYKLPADEALTHLESDQHGLPWNEVEKRWNQYGQNAIESDKKINRLRIFLDQLINPLVLILFMAAGISIIADHIVDAIVIGVIIIINSLIGYIQESKAEEALEALKNRAAPEATVLRINHDTGESVEQIIAAADIVPGDVILLETGDKVPADARLLTAINLEVDESMLTGESLPVQKTSEKIDGSAGIGDRLNLVYSGTAVTHGRGKAVVYATGIKTEIGKIAALILQTEKITTPLKRQADKLGKYLALFAVAFSTLVFIIGLFNLNGSSWQDIFLFALSSAISSIPEGLPAVMTITLAVGVNRMAKRNAIIRKLQAVDTLGAASVICTDKTGTLTTNQMTVQQIYSDGQIVDVSGVGFNPEGGFAIHEETQLVKANTPLFWTLAGGALCNDARLTYNEEHKGNEWSIKGDPTEGALIVLSAKAHLWKDQLEDDFPRVDEIPFDSKRKFMATFHEDQERRSFVFLKGAPEEVLDLCGFSHANSDVKKLSDEEKQLILDQNRQMAEKAMRVLAVAYFEGDKGSWKEIKERIHQGKGELIFSGLIGMIDPPREEAKEAIRVCRQAGIRVIMATGDHPITAKAIAEELNMIDQDSRVLTGADVDEMSEEEFDRATRDTAVFARVSPELKYRLVESLKRQGEVVAMTGDGINDAPALKSAQVGVAMGIAGTDVAKEASDMVLTDDNFSSIVNAVEEGRVVFQNIRKVVKFLISTNFGEDLTILLSMLLFKGLPLIFTPVQILWVNLVTDGVLDITIAMEPKEQDVMNETPRKINAQIVNKEILLNTLFVAAIMAVGTLFMFNYGYQNYGIVHARTIAFVTLALFQVFNAFNVRSRTKSVFAMGLFTNKYLNIAIPVSVLLLIATVYVPFMQNVMQTSPLLLKEWAMMLPIASSILFLDELRKAWQANRAVKQT
ncbi:MAG: HAD-IC family P-type ATPase [Chloroflexi bacterium]|nr:HAD-IC family P-type ATPase [Chloroflexota bacterium]